jgi:hypothetical protein
MDGVPFFDEKQSDLTQRRKGAKKTRGGRSSSLRLRAFA